MTIDLDKEHLCPECDEPMAVSMPIWITPGQQIDTGNIDYESGNPQCSHNWWCDTCQSHHFPNEPEDIEDLYEWNPPLQD